MDEVKDMLDGTKTSVDHLVPKSEEIFNQVCSSAAASSLYGRLSSDFWLYMSSTWSYYYKNFTDYRKRGIYGWIYSLI